MDEQLPVLITDDVLIYPERLAALQRAIDLMTDEADKLHRADLINLRVGLAFAQSEADGSDMGGGPPTFLLAP